MTNAKRIHVYLTQRYGPDFPRSFTEYPHDRLSPKQRRRAARKGFREEVQAT
jgi:hypothetical protein